MLKSIWKKSGHVTRNEQVAGSIPIVGFTFQALTRHPAPPKHPSVDKRCQGCQYAVLFLVIMTLVSCGYTCRRVSVDEARYWQSQGYQAQIVIYQIAEYPKASEDTSLVYPATLIYTHHAQAQVLVNGKWKWASNHTLSDVPEGYPIGAGETYLVDDWYQILISQGYYN